MDKNVLLNILGWSFLVSSWVLPKLIFRKNELKKRFFEVVLTLISIGLFSWVLLSNL